MATRQRTYLKSPAMKIDPIFQTGKSNMTPELIAVITGTLEARELIKLSVLENCMDDGHPIAEILAERIHSEAI